MQDEETWARDSLRDVALEGIRERRRARRWGIFFKLAVLAYLFALLFFSARPLLGLGADASAGPHTAVVEIEGPIMADSRASAERVIAGLERAFEAPQAQGVMLKINSPGGSPVESSRIYQAIQALREAHPDMPVHAVAGDAMASGAYYIAAAADEIHVDGASIVGSIGVISRGFGFSEAIDRLGIERRVYAAGDEKAGMDPFTEPDPDEEARMQDMLDGIHEQFIDAVRAGRGERLDTKDETLFSGRIWTGEQGIALGLADGLGTPRTVAAEVIGAEQRIEYAPPRPFLDRALERVGGAAARVWLEMQHPALTH
ncbi:peptidase S49 [Spiribacter salinus M19-40]|jgi:protease-4|uniref:Peptidase S49 n=1 Tax=Spiribacter salinus M19-40 TaxID=1260251 RepID=R4V4N7_9GAMM|nr:S49 family peptidase [Spiribacter salinus]AGM40914.1 peptidase S49 [Spiribacter salinus M19-40]MBY5268144.1 peptidase S49 [Spiribacter salinus]